MFSGRSFIIDSVVAALPRFSRSPLVATKMSFNNEKRIFVRTKFTTSLYSSPRFLDNNSAIRLWYFVHSGPIPPVVENIRGEKDPFSTLRIRWLYVLFFFAFVLNTSSMDLLMDLLWRSARMHNSHDKRERAVRSSAFLSSSQPQRSSVFLFQRYFDNFQFRDHGFFFLHLQPVHLFSIIVNEVRVLVVKLLVMMVEFETPFQVSK